jgi:hypothetical protein
MRFNTRSKFLCRVRTKLLNFPSSKKKKKKWKELEASGSFNRFQNQGSHCMRLQKRIVETFLGPWAVINPLQAVLRFIPQFQGKGPQHSWTLQAININISIPSFSTQLFLSCFRIVCFYLTILSYLLTYSLTYGAEPFLRSCQLCSYSRTSQHFMEPEGSLPCSQEPSTDPYPKPDQSSPYHSIPSL